MRPRSNARVAAAMLAVAAAAALIAAPPTDDMHRPRAGDVAILRARAIVEFVRDGGRPPFRPRPASAAGLATPPGDGPPGYGPVQTVDGPDQRWRLAFADGALPFSYEVDAELAGLVGLGEIVRAISAWDGAEGSRWSTRFLRVSRRPLDQSYADGVSTVYLRKRCRFGLLGSVRWQLDPSVATLDVRGGTGAVFTSEVDIAVCPQAQTGDRVRRTLLHEVGHVMGLEHLCERGQRCGPAVQGAPPRCRVMHWQLHGCGEQLREAERDLTRQLYPTLPRLWGPTPVDTAVRASYATVATQDARRIVLARPGTHPWQLASVLLEAAPDDAPLLLAEPGLAGCVPAPAGSELSRAAARGALVTLVGAWPPNCEPVLRSWGLRVERRASPAVATATGAGRMAAQLAAADQVLRRHASDGEEVTELVVAPLPSGVHNGELDGGETALVWSAAAVAARLRAPLVLIAGGRLPTALARWLAERPAIRTLHAIGGVDKIHPLVLHDVRRAGLATIRVGGIAPPNVTTATLIGFPGVAPLFAAPAGSPDEQAIAASLATRIGGPLAVLAGDSSLPLRGALAVRRPRGGALVASPSQVAAPVHWALTTRVLEAEDPRLEVGWQFRRLR